MTQPKIREFQNENRFLSNFWTVPINYNGYIFQSSEHAYQAAKCADIKDMEQFIGITAGEAKRLGRTVKAREDWESVKVGIMHEILRIKFSHPVLMRQLACTGNKELQEGNHWHDTFWGVDLRTGEGENNLGVLLMKVREEIRNGV